jgi:cyclic dehypoxanthinyl futalosine synthase
MGINREQALDCVRSTDLVGIGMEADAVRRRLHPDGVVGYVVEARIDGTSQAGWSTEQQLGAVCTAIADAADRGATTMRLATYGDSARELNLLQAIRVRFPALWIEGVLPAEFTALTMSSGAGLHDALARLMDAGLNSIADDGIDLAGASKTQIAGWIELHHVAHRLGMRTVASVVFGTGESAEQRLDFLEDIRNLQAETEGFAAFAPKAAAAPNGRELDGMTAVERLKMLAIARMFLDTIENVQASASPQGLKVLQMALRFGANDIGGTAPAGGREEDVRRIIRDAGFRPAEREMGYRAMVIAY